jgi:hypothetical protein
MELERALFSLWRDSPVPIADQRVYYRHLDLLRTLDEELGHVSYGTMYSWLGVRLCTVPSPQKRQYRERVLDRLSLCRDARADYLLCVGVLLYERACAIARADAALSVGVHDLLRAAQKDDLLRLLLPTPEPEMYTCLFSGTESEPSPLPEEAVAILLAHSESHNLSVVASHSSYPGNWYRLLRPHHYLQRYLQPGPPYRVELTVGTTLFFHTDLFWHGLLCLSCWVGVPIASLVRECWLGHSQLCH